MRTPKVVTDTLLLLARSFREGRRNPVVAFVLPVVFPLSMIALTSQAYSAVVLLPGFPVHPYAAYLAPGIVVLTAMMAAGYAATALVVDAQSGFLDRLRMLPVSRTSILLGRMLFEVVRVVPASIAILAVGLAFGARLDHGLAGAAVVVGLVALWSLSYNGVFAVVALRTRNAASSIALIPVMMPLMFLSPAFLPTSLQPHWIQTVSAWNPYTYVIQGARSLLTGGFAWAPLGEALGVAGALLIVSQLLTIRSFATLMEGD